MSKKVLHLIGQAHLDPAWLWPWRDGLSESLTTMQSAIDRMNETGNFKFSRSSAITYKWVQESDPRLFEEIRTRVAEKRWEIVNGWIVQPDCNMPSTESFARQSLYGKGFFRKEFGVDVEIGYNVDSFGHAAGLPQILAKSGYKRYVFMRPHRHELDIPTLFWWESPDGSRVLTWRIPGGYCQSYAVTPEMLETALREAAENGFANGFDHAAFFLGIGNHGGGPSKAQIKKILELHGDESLPELRFSTLEEFFAEIESSEAFDDIPVVKGELQHHATGCYAAMGEVKKLNRAAEKTLYAAESISCLACESISLPYDREEIRDAWWELLFNQFHDILAGTCVERCYHDARNGLGGVLDTGKKIVVSKIHALARTVDTSTAPAGVLCVFNPLPWERRAPLRFDALVAPDGKENITHLATESGKCVPLQWTAADASFGPHLLEWKKLSAMVELPALGYRVFKLATGPAPHASENSPGKPAPNISVDPERLGITSLTTPAGVETLAAPISLVALKDESDTWGHDRYSYREEVGRPELLSTETLEDGVVLRTVRQKARWLDSDIIMDITTYAESSLVEILLRVDWRRKREILKIELPTTLSSPRVFAKVAGTTLERDADGTEKSGQDWVALTEGTGDGAVSLAVLNDSTYSYDCLRGLFRSVVARSVPFAEHDPIKLKDAPETAYLDQGVLERTFWITAADSDWRSMNIDRLAEETQIPAERVVDSAHPGSEPWERSLLSVEPASIAVTAVKMSEKDGKLILRLLETVGESVDAEIRVGAAPSFKTRLGPNELKTIQLENDGAFREVSIME
ncbi:MAG: alpha-mannosidase [Kiritimatiellaeota bacterium]|nr:alpha-mannosidase [Kiritimatiellota bacterium]